MLWIVSIAGSINFRTRSKFPLDPQALAGYGAANKIYDLTSICFPCKAILLYITSFACAAFKSCPPPTAFTTFLTAVMPCWV